MAHECEDCGESFETLTRLRTHDCGGTGGVSGSASSFGGASDVDIASDAETATSSSTTGRSASVPELDDQIERVSDGEFGAVFAAVATFESAQSSALDAGDGGDTYRDVFWSYYEPVADRLDAATRSEGWGLLADVVAAYDPAEGDDVSHATPAIANAVGRHVIRTRVTDGVEAVPVTALEYLDSVAVEATDVDDTAVEETHAYGWGIGHPDHAVVDRLRERVPEVAYSVNPVLEHAFYADQYAAVDALERLVRDESIDGSSASRPGTETSYRRFFLDCVYGLGTDDYWPSTPRYWDWHEELDYAFELDESVEQRIRNLVAETGFDADLPDDWTFRDLGI